MEAFLGCRSHTANKHLFNIAWMGKTKQYIKTEQRIKQQRKTKNKINKPMTPITKTNIQRHTNKKNYKNIQLFANAHTNTKITNTK